MDPSIYPSHVDKDGVVRLGKSQQRVLMAQAEMQCMLQLNHTDPPPPDPYCPGLFDSMACWPDTMAGHVAVLPCPAYINKFLVEEKATKTCTESGQWFVHPTHNVTWSNYTSCFQAVEPQEQNVSILFREHVDRITLLYTIGYSVSLVSLVLAIGIMIGFKKLHCPRNIVHIHLFVSFTLRCVTMLLRQYLFVDGLGFSKDFYTDPSGKAIFTAGTHWECKLLMTLFHYILGANYMWIFVEGLYLHTLIFVAVFSENSSVRWYIVLGWTSPIAFVLPWVIVKALLDNTYCWNTNNYGYVWIIKAPIIIAIVVNFVFFINIIRVLFTKLSAMNTPEARKYRYIKLAKSTLVLIPLFGVYYIVFIWIQGDIANPTLEVAKHYIEMFFSSFQGFFVALLFCFLNGEVRGELKKKWMRYRLRHGFGSPARSTNTMSTYMPRGLRGSSVHEPSVMERSEVCPLPNGKAMLYEPDPGRAERAALPLLAPDPPPSAKGVGVGKGGQPWREEAEGEEAYSCLMTPERKAKEGESNV